MYNKAGTWTFSLCLGHTEKKILVLQALYDVYPNPHTSDNWFIKGKIICMKYIVNRGELSTGTQKILSWFSISYLTSVNASQSHGINYYSYFTTVCH